MLSKISLFLKLVVIVLKLGCGQLITHANALVHRYQYRSTLSVKNVVVVGGSFAGFTCAKQLAGSLPSGWRVILVERSSHFRFTWLFPRVSVLPRHAKKSFIPYPETPKSAPVNAYVFKQGEVKHLEKDYIVLANGERIDFGYLVIATGMSTRYPYSIDESTKDNGVGGFHELQRAVQEAGHIAVIGGGPVGVEIAFDIKSMDPSKIVTLFHSRDQLCNNYNAALHNVCMKTAAELGVTVVLSERPQISQLENKQIKLKSGEYKTFDLVINCIGQKVDTTDHFLGLSKNVISERGLIKVKSTLQIQDENRPNVFVIGDIADTGTKQMGRAASLQGMRAADNIVRLMKGRKPSNYVPGLIEQSIDLTLGMGKHLTFVQDGATNISFASKTSDETLRVAQMWKMLDAKPFDDKMKA